MQHTLISTRTRHHHGDNLLAHALIRHTQYRYRLHMLMGIENILNLTRIHRIAVTQNHVFNTIHNKNIALLINTSNIAGRKPFAVKNLSSSRRIIPVASHYVLTAHPQLTAHTRRALGTLRATDLHLHTRQHTTHRTEHHAKLRLVKRTHRRRLTQTVALIHRALNQRFQRRMHRRRQRRTTRNAETDATTQRARTLRLSLQRRR